MSRVAEFTTLLRMARGLPEADSHAARLEAFYRPQAEHYDAFRERLLAGRSRMLRALALRAGQRVVELGAGTGRNAEYIADVVPGLQSLTLVDLCPALLEQARRRAARWPNCRVVEADAATYRERNVDRVYLSYALSMMPDWRGVLDNALAMLAPDGLLGVVDFYVSEARPPRGYVTHGAWTRRFWPWWFAHDGVHLHGQVLRRLHERLDLEFLHEGRAPLPWLPGLTVPYFIFIGRPRR